MYKYWTSFESTEHYLYPKEVAILWDIFSCSNLNLTLKHNNYLANEILKESCRILGKDPVYYDTKHGLKRVFDHETILHAYDCLNKNYEKDGAVCYYPLNGKRYKFFFTVEELTPVMQQLHPERFEEDGTFIRSHDRAKERKEELKRREKQ